MIKFLLWIGFVAKDNSDKIVWPFHAPPKWIIKYLFKGVAIMGWKPYVFRNLPGIIKWKKGRLLPRRWGFGWLGFEFGDRGH